MNAMRNIALATLLCAPLLACGTKEEVAAKVEQKQGFIARQIADGMAEAKKKLETENIGINHVSVKTGHGRHGVTIDAGDDEDNLPKAEINPTGELLIEGKAVATTPEQKAQLLAYRREIIAIAHAGMDIGANAAELGLSTAKEALLGVITGKDDADIEAKVKAKTGTIEQAAKQLCAHMPPLLATQQQLAATLPEFKPYATMRQKDVDDCGKDDDNAMTDEQRAKLQAEIREKIRDGIRKGAQTATGN